jgi:3-phosphoshikimate 1-carboxyvinyltransferase
VGALASGETVIEGLLEVDDVMRTASALRALGAAVTRQADGAWRVRGFGVGGGLEPDDVLDFGSSMASARLLAGILASHGFTSFITGDATLRRRSMQRVVESLSRMGARFVSRTAGRLPLAIVGTDALVPVEHQLPPGAAQAKSALLLAGLNTAGETSVVERAAGHDHTERLLRHFGAEVRVAETDGGGRRTTIVGWPDLAARRLAVPGDASAAAFVAAAAATRPHSDVTIENVGLNPARIGLYDALRRMGADIAVENRREAGGEPVGDLRVKGAALKGVDVPTRDAGAMLDEYAVLAVVAAAAEGPTRLFHGAELPAANGQRLASLASGLRMAGVACEFGPDGLVVHGAAGGPPGGGLLASHGDPCLAMCFLVLGLSARAPIAIDDETPIDRRFPSFAAGLRSLGASIEAP